MAHTPMTRMSGTIFVIYPQLFLDYENSLNPHEDRKEGVEFLSRLCTDTIVPSPKMRLARSLLKSGKVKARDALRCRTSSHYFIAAHFSTQPLITWLKVSGCSR